MKRLDLDSAAAEANRFLELARDLRGDEKTNWDHIEAGYGNPKTAAVRRASMDLTRALAKLRRGA